MVHESILQNSIDTSLQILLPETWSSAVFDSSASITFCGMQWFNEYIESLFAQDKSKVSEIAAKLFDLEMEGSS